METIDVLEALNECTVYRVKGKSGLSEEWLLERGLREGCATSPVLINLYHAVAIERAANKRTLAAREKGQLAMGRRTTRRKRDS